MADQLAANALTTPERVCELIGLEGSDIIFLINAASDFFESQTNREFARVDIVKEPQPTFGTTRLRVDRTPIVSITLIEFDEGPLTVDDFTIDDADAGLIFKPSGWLWTAHTAPDISRTVLPGTERKLTEITYRAGFVLPQQDGDANPPVDGDARDLPFDLERAVMSIMQQMRGALNRDPSVIEERLLSWRAKYNTNQFTNPFVETVIRKYERFI